MQTVSQRLRSNTMRYYRYRIDSGGRSLRQEDERRDFRPSKHVQRERYQTAVRWSDHQVRRCDPYDIQLVREGAVLRRITNAWLGRSEE